MRLQELVLKLHSLKDPLKNSQSMQTLALCMQVPSQPQPEYLATDNNSSLWTCSFCHSECGSFATAPVLEARLEITDEAGDLLHLE